MFEPSQALCVCVCLWVSEVKCEEENSSGAEQLVKRERVKSEGGSSSSSSDGSSGSSSEEEEEKEKEEGEKYEPDLDLENDFPLGILYWNLYSLVLKLALGHIKMMAHPSYTTHTHRPNHHVTRANACHCPALLPWSCQLLSPVATATLYRLAKKCFMMATVVVVCGGEGPQSPEKGGTVIFHSNSRVAICRPKVIGGHLSESRGFGDGESMAGKG